MQVWDLAGGCQVDREDELLARLQSSRRGADGAFILDHGGDDSLWLHTHGDAAFVCYFPGRDNQHPGYVPNGMWQGEDCSVRFQLVDGHDGDAIEVDASQLVTIETAYQAAVEYFHDRCLPRSIHWREND